MARGADTVFPWARRAATVPATVAETVATLRAEGRSVSAQRAIPQKLRYATLCDLRKEGAK